MSSQYVANDIRESSSLSSAIFVYINIHVISCIWKNSIASKRTAHPITEQCVCVWMHHNRPLQTVHDNIILDWFTTLLKTHDMLISLALKLKLWPLIFYIVLMPDVLYTWQVISMQWVSEQLGITKCEHVTPWMEIFYDVYTALLTVSVWDNICIISY